MSSDMQNFIGLSAVLTGFNQEILAPELDPVDIKSEYLPLFESKIAQESGDPQLVQQILLKYASLAAGGGTEQEIGTAMLDPSNGANWVLACRKLIYTWYAGAWPTLIPPGPSKPASTVGDVISAESYTAGLVWQVMQSHPMGDSNYRYGYWATKPASLSDYTGNP
ncbi:hypothetical protein [Dyella mobilis]|uniref:Sorbitol dehydrogenase n=1 Tax=Dyella mobilis TaxID=1849582 RepID=A0ABS2KDC3_9GAMM|nr:hypothetical protein [Dyella mobilis]MBM7128944.1 hypothetical protein [Dyella mobilis]GLQ99366.1 hypothetical protein GCM10007863_37860 [Dyella mobilis]